jgi:Holliday junction resolvase-like predicted endonuclease
MEAKKKADAAVEAKKKEKEVQTAEIWVQNAGKEDSKDELARKPQAANNGT